MSKDIRAAIERSSLGTKKAAAARRSVSASEASKVVERSNQTGRFSQKVPRKLGGSEDSGTYT